MHRRCQASRRLHVVAAIGQLEAQLVDMLEELVLLGEQLLGALAAMLGRTQAGVPAAVESLPESHGTHTGNGTQHKLRAVGERGEQRIQILVQRGVNVRPQRYGLALKICKEHRLVRPSKIKIRKSTYPPPHVPPQCCKGMCQSDTNTDDPQL